MCIISDYSGFEGALCKILHPVEGSDAFFRVRSSPRGGIYTISFGNGCCPLCSPDILPYMKRSGAHVNFFTEIFSKGWLACKAFSVRLHVSNS
jgi:hypothetical protein